MEAARNETEEARNNGMEPDDNIYTSVKSELMDDDETFEVLFSNVIRSVSE